MNHLIGAHTSTSGGVQNAVDLADKLNFSAMQIFSKNNNRWAAKPFTDQIINEFKTKLNSSGIKITVVHDSYLINLCSLKDELLEK
ncbi:MAG: deoxyribonuclease IV, partial [Ignavibacteriaceae bacterium]